MDSGADRSRIQSMLGRDERLLWSGRPPRGLLLRSQDAFLVPFSLLWCGFVVFWLVLVTRKDAPAFFLVFGCAFLLIGVHIVAGRFVVDLLQRRRTAYAVTSERVIIVSGLLRESVLSIPLRSLPPTILTVRPDGSGDISFGPRHPFEAFVVPGWPGFDRLRAPAFEGIPGAKEVHELLRAGR